MISDLSPDAKTSARVAEPPWNEHSEAWRQLDAQLPCDHLAREIRDAMTPLALAPLYTTYRGRGKAPHRPDLMLAIGLFELRPGQRQPSPWYPDTLATYPLGGVGFGIRPWRSCWYECRDRAGADVDTLHATLLPQAVDEELTTAERGALDGSAVAAHASRQRLLNSERLEKRLDQLEAALEDEAHGEAPGEGPGGMAHTPRGRTRQPERYRQRQAQLATRPAANAQRPPSPRRAPDKIVVRPGDPEAPVGLDQDGVFRPLYTVQTGRDVESPLILGYEVFAQSSDAATLPPMLQRRQQLSKRSARSVQRSEHEERIEAHRAWMETAEAKAVDRLRGQTIEIVLADVKEYRGLRRFSGHGLARVRTEFALEVLLHNLLVVHQSLRQKSEVEAIHRMTEDIAA